MIFYDLVHDHRYNTTSHYTHNGVFFGLNKANDLWNERFREIGRQWLKNPRLIVRSSKIPEALQANPQTVFARCFMRGDDPGVHVLKRSHRRDSKMGSAFEWWDIRERTADVASGTARESKNPGTRAAKSSISLSSSRAVSVHLRAFVTTADPAPKTPSSTLFRRLRENRCRRILTCSSSTSHSFFGSWVSSLCWLAQLRSFDKDLR